MSLFPGIFRLSSFIFSAENRIISPTCCKSFINFDHSFMFSLTIHIFCMVLQLEQFYYHTN